MDMDYCLAYIEKKFHPKENPLHNGNIGNVPGFLQCQSSPDYVYGVLMAIPNQRLTKFNKSAQKLHQDTLSQSVRFHFHPFSFSILFLSFQIFQMIRMQTASIIFDPPCRPRFRRVLATARWSWPPCEHVDGSWWSQIILIFHVSQLIFRESQPRNWSTQVTLKAYPAIFFQMSWKNPSAQQQAILLLVDLQSPLQEVTLRR